MPRRIDLNADMGESFGDWTMGDDAALLGVVTSANVACGYHAGDPDVMAATMRAAAAAGVGIGAHPGLPDLQGFGRRRMSVASATLANMVRYQLGAAIAIAASVGGRVRHFKLHGALSNMASEDEALARTCFDAARDVAPDIVVFALAGTAMQRAAEASGGPWAGEIFADRAYADDATLVDRRRPGAVIHDPSEAAGRIDAMIAEGAIITGSGRRIRARIDTICVHGDNENALRIARAVRDALVARGAGPAMPAAAPDPGAGSAR